ERIPFNVKGISSIEDISILRITGGGLIGGFDILHRIFKVLAERNINVILITQGSSEYSLCLAVLPKQTKIAKNVIEQELKNEIRDNQIKEVLIENDLSIIAVVGEDMRHTIGIAGKIFQTMGENGVNLVAIAQGSSELNISMVIHKKDLSKALNVLHTKIFKPNKIECNLFLAGPGLIGSNVLKILEKEIKKYPDDSNIKFKLIGLADIKGYTFNKNGINISNWKSFINKNVIPRNEKKFIDEIINLNLTNSVFVDCTAHDNYVQYYEKLLSSNISVVTPNKIANTSSFELFEKLKDITKNKKSKFKYSANVGAGTPMISVLQDLVAMGDRIHKIEGVFSGTLSYIFNNLKEGKKFSEIVRLAKEQGFTEPDPRDDLSGLDMARKLLILIREAGYKLEFKDIKVENLVPKEAQAAKNIDEFFEILKKFDDKFQMRRIKALKQGKVLCYIASCKNGKAKLGIEEIDSKHPFYNLYGNDNIVAFTTDYYNENPLTLRGRGAGAEFTAHSVFSDILRVLK
ncbi:MAG: ACT domain-containing protein, partial [Ignavibacteriales bacterium]|nr:ACT domain-containing protein [Ignavibacteriales bacterium]